MIALFDFDGVIMDTEDQYTQFWSGLGDFFFNDKNFGNRVKGQTLKQIFEQYVPDLQMRVEIEAAINKFEYDMPYRFVPGADRFLEELKKAGVPTAIVTSSNSHKMENVYRAYPDFTEKVDIILTAEYFTRSKPAPDCFLLGMEKLGGTPESTFIFEDSFHGLQAARDAGGIVIGLATTNPREAILPKADHVIDNFIGITPDHLKSWLMK